MRVTRLYCEGKLTPGSSVVLPKESAHYLINVLRLTSGDTVYLFNEQFGEFIGRIEKATMQYVTIIIESKHQTREPSSLKVHLGLGLSKGYRMDYAIQKSTELGVSSITPLYTKYSEVRFNKTKRLENKLQHWRRIVISSCEQSGRLSIPEIHPPMSIEGWLESSNKSCRLILDVRGAKTLENLEIINPVELAIGPEGGFSTKELQIANDRGFTTISLGSRILRSETAPVAALAILQHRYGDM